VKTSTEPLDGSRVRVAVEVPSADVERQLVTAAGALGNDLKIPGFRKGKIPPQVVLQRVGREAVWDEALRRSLPDWYEQAIADAGIAAVGSPKLDLGEVPAKGEDLAFAFEVGVRPEAKLGDIRGLEAGRREAEVGDEQVEDELGALRESLASLENVERAAADGDFVVMDYLGRVDGEPFEGGEGRGVLVELGSGRLVPGFEEQLVGAAPGDSREVTITFPDDYPAEQMAGKQATFDVEVKEVKEKRLPELDDDFAAEAGGFDTVDELRDDMRERLRQAHERAIEREFREAVVDAAVAAATIDIPHDLVHARAHEMWETTARRLQQQGISPAQYAQLSGKSEHDLIDEIEPDAERALARESVLAAVAQTEGIEVSDDEVLESLRAATPPEQGVTEEQLRKSFERAKERGRAELLREDIAMRKAVDLLVEHAKPIPLAQAEAREAIWTPEKEEKPESKQLWTPGSS
jgi:trigger factor